MTFAITQHADGSSTMVVALTITVPSDSAGLLTRDIREAIAKREATPAAGDYITTVSIEGEIEDGTTADCAHCEGEIVIEDGIWYHSRIEDFSHLARPAKEA